MIRDVNKFLLNGTKPKYYERSDGDCCPPDTTVRTEKLLQSRSDQSMKSEQKNRNKKKRDRIEKAIKKIMDKNGCDYELAMKMAKDKHELKINERTKSKVKQLEDLLKLPDDKQHVHKLEIKFVSTSFTQNKMGENEYIKSVMPVEHAVYAKYQSTIHNDDPNECTPRQFQRFLVDSPLTHVVSSCQQILTTF